MQRYQPHYIISVQLVYETLYRFVFLLLHPLFFPSYMLYNLSGRTFENVSISILKNINGFTYEKQFVILGNVIIRNCVMLLLLHCTCIYQNYLSYFCCDKTEYLDTAMVNRLLTFVVLKFLRLFSA